MRIDTYTKIVLTVIATCLLWSCLERAGVIATTHAQNEYQRVVIVGWQAHDGRYINFPDVSRHTRNAGMPVLTSPYNP